MSATHSSPANRPPVSRRNRRLPIQRCVVCREVWPDQFLVVYGDHCLCCRCHVRLKDSAFRKENRSTLEEFRIRRPMDAKLKAICWGAAAMVVLVTVLLSMEAMGKITFALGFSPVNEAAPAMSGSPGLL